MKMAKIICLGKPALRRGLMNLEDSLCRAGVFGDARQAVPVFATRSGDGFKGGFRGALRGVFMAADRGGYYGHEWGYPTGLGLGYGFGLPFTTAIGLSAVIRIVGAVASMSTFGMLKNMEVSRMKKGKFFFVILCGILIVVSASWAQTGSPSEAVTNSRGADSPVVNVYGPEVLTDLATQAIQEKRPDVVIVQYDKPLKNKVLI
jgi:hypothetical protein